MEQSLTPEQIWDCWKSTFNQWGQRWYGRIWEKDFSAKEITEGVLEPYILTGLAPALGCRVRFHQNYMDAIVFDKDGSNELAHFEYDNEPYTLIDEIPKLRNSKPPLKCMVTFFMAYEERQRNRDKMMEFLQHVLQPAVADALRDNPSQVWLFICTTDRDWDEWTAFKYTCAESGVTTSKLP